MVKIKNIFGDEYSGAAGKAGVFAKWKGRQYRRKYVIPANPKTTMQTAVRNHFTNAVATWHTWSSLRKKAYSYLATGLVMSGFNLLVRRYQLWKLVGKTEILDPIMGIKQIGAGDETNVPDEATFDSSPKKTAYCPVIIGSFKAGSGGTPLECDVIVNSEMGDCMIPVDIVNVNGYAAGGDPIATGDKLVISYTAAGRTVTQEVLAEAEDIEGTWTIVAKTAIADALRTAHYPVDLESAHVYIYDLSAETYIEIDSVTIVNRTGEVNANKTGATHTTETCTYDYYTALEDAKLEVVKADTSFITWRDYSDEEGFIPIAQTVFDQDYDFHLTAANKDPEIRAAQGASDVAKHEYIGMEAA